MDLMPIVLLSALPILIISVSIFRTKRSVRNLSLRLSSSVSSHFRKVDFNELESLPSPVARYFRTVLKNNQKMIGHVSFQQIGQLRTNLDSSSWMNFKAEQRIYPLAKGSLWNAKIKIWGPIYIQVLDSYSQAVGAGKVLLQSLLPIAQDRDKPELNSGALHRYLAEAVWCPTALLPESGVMWSPLDENRALASLQDRGVSVSLEFHFDEMGEISGIYTPGRWGSFNGGYKQVAWEGHFSDYCEVHGIRVPTKGEVGWYENGELKIVWKGEILPTSYLFS